VFCEYRNIKWGNIFLYLKVKWATHIGRIVLDKKLQCVDCDYKMRKKIFPAVPIITLPRQIRSTNNNNNNNNNCCLPRYHTTVCPFAALKRHLLYFTHEFITSWHFAFLNFYPFVEISIGLLGHGLHLLSLAWVVRVAWFPNSSKLSLFKMVSNSKAFENIHR
jgi:hypothetical protein